MKEKGEFVYGLGLRHTPSHKPDFIAVLAGHFKLTFQHKIGHSTTHHLQVAQNVRCTGDY